MDQLGSGWHSLDDFTHDFARRLAGGFDCQLGLAVERYSTGPTRQGTNSLWPSNSLFVRSPEATRRIRSKIRWPTSSTVSLPSTMAPALMSMLSSITAAICEFDAILMTGTTGEPMPEPRPVVNTIIFAPPAAMPVSETGS